MKKIFMTLAAVACAATMNAQLYVGGQLGFTSENIKNEVSACGEGLYLLFAEPKRNLFFYKF